MDKKTLANYLDFANHHSDSTPQQIKDLCKKVKEYGFHSAFVNSCWVTLARDCLGEKITVGTVVDFPLGQENQDTKILAAIASTRKGADELDVCLNIGQLIAGNQEEVYQEAKAIVEAVKSIRSTTLVKFIIATAYLTDEQIKTVSQIVLKAKADFIKTNSGFGPRGASLKDVELIKQAVGDQIKIKVAGGIDTYQEAVDFIKAGASRIGTSKAVAIIEGS